MNHKSSSELQAIDFFCGAGGVTCGFRKAGISTLGGIDIDEACKVTYQKNHDLKFLNKSLSDMDKTELRDFFNIMVGQDNLVFIGCSPCQYYSKIYTDKSKSAKSRLLLSDFQEFVEYYKPGYVFIENVPGLEKKKDSPLQEFKCFLTVSGYTIDEEVTDAKYHGVPQSRRRYILLASRVNEKIELPTASNHVKTVRHAIGDKIIFPPINAGHVDTTEFMHSAANLSVINYKRIIATPHDGGDRRSWRHDDKLQLQCYKGHEGHYDVYGRMHWNKPAPAITTKFNSYSNGRYGHPEQNRAISLREGATLQTFPLDYVFVSNNQRKKAQMIGNAVPPELARRIGVKLIKLFEEAYK